MCVFWAFHPLSSRGELSLIYHKELAYIQAFVMVYWYAWWSHWSPTYSNDSPYLKEFRSKKELRTFLNLTEIMRELQ